MIKPLKALRPEQLAKLSTKERQVYLEQRRKQDMDSTKLIARALAQGIREKIKTL